MTRVLSLDPYLMYADLAVPESSNTTLINATFATMLAQTPPIRNVYPTLDGKSNGFHLGSITHIGGLQLLSSPRHGINLTACFGREFYQLLRVKSRYCPFFTDTAINFPQRNVQMESKPPATPKKRERLLLL